MRLEPSDLQLISDGLLRHFTVEELEKLELLDRVPDRALRVQLAEVDLEFFCRFYLPHHFTKKPVPMHGELARDLVKIITTPGRNNNVVAWPRGHGKTTWVTLGLPLWCAALTKRHHILIISDSLDQSKGQLATIKDELESNERLQEDFHGPFRGVKWEQTDIETAQSVKVVALGTGMKIRGRKYKQHRPDLIIIDDPEELKAVQSETMRESTQKWFFRSVMRAGWEDTKVFAIGNFIHFACLTRVLHQNPLFHSKTFKAVISWATNQELWDEWLEVITDLSNPQRELTAELFFKQNEAEMLLGTEVAWPDAYTYYELMTMRVSEGRAAFSMEMQNEPVDPSERMFKHHASYRREFRDGFEWLTPLNGRPTVRLVDCTIFGSTDPSLGQTAKANPSAIVLIARAPGGQGFILEVDKKRRQPDLIIEAQNRWASTYPIARWGIESVQFQAFYATESAKASMAAGTYIDIVPLPQSGRGNKDLRIASLQPAFENEYLLINELGQESLKQEMYEYPASAEDDALDALEMCWRIASLYRGTTSTNTIERTKHSFDVMTSRVSRARNRDKWAKYDEAADALLLERMRRESNSAEGDAAVEAFANRLETEWCLPVIIV